MYNLSRRSMLKAGVGAAVLAGSGFGNAAAQEQPKKGGDLRIALLGGSATDAMDAHRSLTLTDQFTIATLYAPLFKISHDSKIVNCLAESLEPNADATAWTLRIVDAHFHDGRKITADDVIASFRRIVNPDAPMPGAVGLRALDAKGMRAIDSRTVHLPMSEPFGALPEFLSIYYMYAIVPADFDPAKPVGSGPFKIKSFVPGKHAVFERFDGYFKGPPHLDTVTILTSFADETAAFNALRSNEVDIFAQAPLSLARRIQNDGGAIKLLASKPGQITPFTMRCNVAPFDNVDVRTAFKLLVDREQMIKLAFNGFGEVGCDVFSALDPDFDHTLKRLYDPEQARALLEKAGYANLEVDFDTADIATGSLLSAQVFAQQARAAGVTINLRKLNTDVFWNESYLNAPFSQTFWPYSPYLVQVSQNIAPGAIMAETRWEDGAFLKYYAEACRNADPAKRSELVMAMQRLEYDNSGYVVATHNPVVDLLSDRVRGLEPDSGTAHSCDGFAFADAWLA